MRAAAPQARRASTVPCSRIPARWRCSTYARVLFSRTAQSMPALWSRRARRRPAGPAPMIPTVVRMRSALEYEREALAHADAQGGEARAGARGGELVGDGSG